MKTPTRIPVTFFAPAEREPIAIVRRQAAKFKEPELPLDLLSSVLNYVFILNRQRQIIFASRNVPQVLPRTKPQARPWLGFRVGEFLGCMHAKETEGGCGTSLQCRKCGAVRAVLQSLTGQANVKQFRLTRFIGGEKDSLQFLALAAPIMHNEETFSLLVLTDGADKMSKQAMQRVLGELTREPMRL
jgi:hypothetical protein